MSNWRSPTKKRRKSRLDCARKQRHDTLAEAETAMRDVQAQGRAAEDCQAYACDLCGGWHWGHTTGRRGGPGSDNSHVN